MLRREKSVSATDVQEGYRDKGGQEKQGEVTVSIEEEPKEASEEQPVVTLEKQAIAVDVGAEPIEPQSIQLMCVGMSQRSRQLPLKMSQEKLFLSSW